MQSFRRLLLSCLLVMGLSLAVSPAWSLTRDVIRSEGHAFTYSIEPNWKMGPIKKSDFRMIFSLYNSDRRSFRLHKISLTTPDNLTVKKRSWDDKPLVDPYNDRVSFESETITFNYDERLRGYVKNKKIKSRLVYVHFKARRDVSVTEPIEITVHWSKPGSDTIHRFSLEKELSINADKPSSKASPSRDERSAKNSQQTTQLNAQDRLKAFFSKMLDNVTDAEARSMVKRLDRTDNPSRTLKQIIKREIGLMTYKINE